LPIVLSLTALAILLGYVAVFGTAKQEDEGTAAHLFQLLMATQALIAMYFTIKWLPQRPKAALQVLALQVLVALLPMALLFYFESRVY